MRIPNEMEQKRRHYYNCSVSGCNNSTINTDHTFFTLPTDPGRRLEWLRVIRREDLLDTAAVHIRVCEVHFTPDSIIKTTNRKILKKHSVPQLLLPDKEADVKPKKRIKMKVDANTQCDVACVFQKDAEVQTVANFTNGSRKRKLSQENQADGNRSKIRKGFVEPSNMNKLCRKLLNMKKGTQEFENNLDLGFKLFCLKLYHTSPQAYILLKDSFNFPDNPIATKIYMPLTTKVDSYLLDLLKIKAEHLRDKDRNCCLILGVRRLKGNYYYNIGEDRIYGFHEVNGVQSSEPARYALVAMIQGLFDNYQQLVGYALLTEYKNYHSISAWIDEIILKLNSIGLYVRTLVSDMSADFLKNARNVSVERPFFYAGGCKIYYMFDPYNLIKLLRNDLMSYEFHFGGNVARWDHIIQFYRIDKLKQIKLAPNLTESHVHPNDFQKSSVKLAVQVMGASVAAGMSAYRDFGLIENSAIGTIKLIEVINNLFDFLTTTNNNGENLYQNAFCGEENQISFLNDMSDLFATLKLIDPNNDRNCTSQAKFIEGFRITLKSLLMLSKDLKINKDFYILTKRSNLDCLGEVLGEVKTDYEGLKAPTTWQQVSIFRKHFLKNILLESKDTEDLAKAILRGKKKYAYFGKQEEDQETIHASNQEPNDKRLRYPRVTSISSTDYNSLDIPERNSIVYVSGWLLRKCLDKHEGCNLLETYTGGENTSQNTQFTRYKEYCKDFLLYYDFKHSIDKNKVFAIPPDSFVEFVETMEKRFFNFFKMNYINCQILGSVLNEIEDLTFPMPCPCFPFTYCKSLYIRMRIYHTLKYNRIIKNDPKFFSVKKL